MKNRNIKLTVMCVVWLLWAGNVLAQTTAFSYQGKLTDAGNPANGNYDFQFKLFDTATVGTGTPHGATLLRPSVAVANGSFTVELDFGVCATCFDGSARFLEIGVRPAGNPNPHTLLGPRVSITSTPYAIQTINTEQLGGLPASRYMKSETNGNVVIGTGTPAHRLAVLGGPCWTGDCWGGALELENSSAIGWRANTSNEKFGIGRTENGLFFFRTMSPLGTTTNPPTYDFKMDNNGNVGIGNIGISTDLSGARLNIFGPGFGFLQSHGTVAVGSFADSSGGWLGTKSNHPLYFFTDNSAPRMTIGANGHVGIGVTNTTAQLHVETSSGLGIVVRSASPDAIGLLGYATAPSGRGMGVVGHTESPDGYSGFFEGRVFIRNQLGIGTDSPPAKLTVSGSGAYNAPGAARFDLFNSSVEVGFLQHVTDNGRWQIATTSDGETKMVISESGNVGINTTNLDHRLTVNGNASKLGGGSWEVFSDERLKTIRGRFTTGLKAVLQLQPLRYEYKAGNALSLEAGGEHIGFGAQAVREIIPEAVKTNDSGYLMINNDPIMWTMLNAIKEQQALIEQQQRQIGNLTKLVSQMQQRADLRQGEKRHAYPKRLTSSEKRNRKLPVKDERLQAKN